MKTIVINYKSGEKFTFRAQEFDIDVTGNPQSYHSALYKFTYKDVDGEDTPIYLVPDSIEGIVVVPGKALT